MYRAALPLAALLFTGCQGCQQPATVVDASQLVGLTVREAVAKLGAQEADCTIGDEPPGIARYVIVELDDGREVHLWLARHPGMMREDRKWPFELVADKPVADIRVR
jgi:hypothetical protein